MITYNIVTSSRNPNFSKFTIFSQDNFQNSNFIRSLFSDLRISKNFVCSDSFLLLFLSFPGKLLTFVELFFCYTITSIVKAIFFMYFPRILYLTFIVCTILNLSCFIKSLLKIFMDSRRCLLVSNS